MTANIEASRIRSLLPGQRSRIWIMEAESGKTHIHSEYPNQLVEAPNWTSNGQGLLVNHAGALFHVDLTAEKPSLTPVQFRGELPRINNDHVLSGDRQAMYMTAFDGQVYRGDLGTGALRQMTTGKRWRYMHGVRLKDDALTYVVKDPGQDHSLLAWSLDGKEDQIIQTGSDHNDGPEWSLDGKTIYFNSESFTEEAGHSQIARIDLNNNQIERLTISAGVDWFPHLSPNGKHAVFLRFPAGTLGHPPNLDVEIHVVDVKDWNKPLHVFPLFGGQGTINVNSWSPDGKWFAFVDYPVDGFSN